MQKERCWEVGTDKGIRQRASHTGLPLEWQGGALNHRVL